MHNFCSFVPRYNLKDIIKLLFKILEKYTLYSSCVKDSNSTFISLSFIRLSKLDNLFEYSCHELPVGSGTIALTRKANKSPYAVYSARPGGATVVKRCEILSDTLYYSVQGYKAIAYVLYV